MLKNKNRILIFAMVVLLVLSLIGSASWMIVKRLSDNATNGKADSNPYFTSSVVYQSGVTQFPLPIDDNPYDFSYELDENGMVDIDDIEYNDKNYPILVTDSFTVEWLEGYDPSETKTDDFINFNSMAPGTHYYKITDNTTGQVIAERHKMTITVPMSLVSGTTPTTDRTVYYEGEQPIYTAQITTNGLGGDHTFSVTLTGEPLVFANGDPSAEPTSKVDTVNVKSASCDDTSYNPEIYTFDVIKKVSLTVRAVAYTASGPCVKGDSTDATTYYGTIEKAITAANSGTNKYVYVSESLTDYSTAVSGSSTAANLEKNLDSYKSLGALTIQGDQDRTTTINPDVTLILPCVEDTTIEATETPDGVDGNTDYNYIKQLNTTTYNGTVCGTTKLMHNISIAAGVTLTNYGTIQIGGIINGGAAGRALNSYTSGAHGQINLFGGAKLTNTGTIECYGFITEASKKNLSELNIDEGSLIMVFSIVEHYGGSALLGMIEPEGDAYEGLNAALQESLSVGGTPDTVDYKPTTLTSMPFNRFYFETVTCTLTTSNSGSVSGFVDLYAFSQSNCANIPFIGGTGSHLYQLTSSNSKATMKFDKDTKVHDLTISGDMTLNHLAIGLLVKTTKDIGISVSIALNLLLSSEDVYLGISNHFNVTLAPDKDGSSTVDMTSQKIKLLPGSSLTIEEGVTVNADSIAVYDSNETLQLYGSKYTNNTPAVLNVGGTLNAKSLGGAVTPISESAKLKVSNSNRVVSYEPFEHYTEGYSVSFSVTYLFVTYHYPQDYTKVKYSPNELSTYTLTLAKAESAQGKSAIAAARNDEYTAKYSSTYGYYWCDVLYNITYDNILPDGYDIDVTNHNTVTRFGGGTHFTPIDPTTTNTELQFLGWYTDDSLGAEYAITEFDGSRYVGNDVTLYAYWAEEYYTLTFTDSTGLIKLGNVNVPKSKISGYDLMSFDAVRTAITSYNNNYNEKTYFVGWYFDPACTVAYNASSIATYADEDTGVVNLYAKWGVKNKITLTTAGLDSTKISAVEVGGTKLESWNQGFYVVPGTKISITATCSYNTQGGSLFGTTYYATVTFAGEQVTFDDPNKLTHTEKKTLYLLDLGTQTVTATGTVTCTTTQDATITITGSGGKS